MTGDNVSELTRALRAMAPDSVQVGARCIEPRDLARLHPDVLALVEKAVPKRQNEFATGRVLLRSLLGTDETVLVLRIAHLIFQMACAARWPTMMSTLPQLLHEILRSVRWA